MTKGQLSRLITSYEQDGAIRRGGGLMLLSITLGVFWTGCIRNGSNRKEKAHTITGSPQN